jgi:hypothetical protein
MPPEVQTDFELKRSLTIPTQRRELSFVADSLNVEDRTINISFGTGVRILVQPFWDEPFYEELSMDPAHVRMGRFKSGRAALLDSHARGRLSDQIGVLDKGWIEKGELLTTARFSKRAEVEPIFQDVVDKIIGNASVGYSVYRYLDVTGPNDKIRVLRAIDWEPFEGSLLPVGADAGAGTRAASVETNPCEIVSQRAQSAQEVNSMPPEVTPAAQTATETKPAAPAVNVEGARAEGQKAGEQTGVQQERARVSAIATLCRKHKMTETFSDKLIVDGVKIEQARELVLEHLASEGERSTARPQVATGGEANGRVEAMRAIENTMLHRINPTKNVLTDEGRNFRGMSFLEIARAVTEARGVNTRGMTRMDLASRGLESTSDLPSIVANVANKMLRDQYQLAPQSWRPLAKPGHAPDFKTMTRVQISGVQALAKVPQGGELKLSYLTDGAETYALASYGLRIALSRQLIINDDMNALVRLPSAFGQSASQTESDIVWGLVTANAAMADTVALFHATHKNLAGSGAAISAATLNDGRTAMKKQKNMEGRTMNLTPKFVACAPEREYEAEQVLSPIVPNQASSVNPFSGKYQILSDARLSPASGKGAWYLFGDPAQCDIIEYSYLEGQEGPYIESQMGFSVDGMEMKCTLDFAAKFLDFRNGYKNAGD